MKYLILVPVATFVLGFWALWTTCGIVLKTNERELCWARHSCDKLKP